jgi:hypothetical protein
MTRGRKILLGCLALPAALLVLLVVAGAIAYLYPAPPARMVERSLEPAPGSLPSAEATAPGSLPSTARQSEGRNEGEGIVAGEAAEIPPGREPGALRRLTLDFEEGELDLRPVATSRPLRVEGRFDESAYALEAHEVDPGHVAVTFRRKVGLLRMLTRLAQGGTANRVVVEVPLGLPLDLDVRVRKAGSSLDLSGLDLGSLDLDVAMGEAKVSFREPSPGPLEALRVRARMGEVRLSGLAHAAPRLLEVRGRMGESHLDFGGELPADVRAVLRWRMGEMHVRVPPSMRVRVERESVVMGELRTHRGPFSPPPLDPELAGGARTLTLDVDVMMGSLHVH